MLSSCTILIRKGFGIEPSTLAVRAAWAMMTNGGLDIKVIVMGDGIYSLLGKSGYIKDMYARFLVEEGELYIVKEDLEARGIAESQLPDGAEVVPASSIYDLIDETESVMTF